MRTRKPVTRTLYVRAEFEFTIHPAYKWDAAEDPFKLISELGLQNKKGFTSKFSKLDVVKMDEGLE